MCTSGSKRPSTCGTFGSVALGVPSGLRSPSGARGATGDLARRTASATSVVVARARVGVSNRPGGPPERACVFHPPRRGTHWNRPMGGSGMKQGREEWCGVTPRMVEITWGLHSRGWKPGVGRCTVLMSSRVAKPHGRAVGRVVPFACEHPGLRRRQVVRVNALNTRPRA